MKLVKKIGFIFSFIVIGIILGLIYNYFTHIHISKETPKPLLSGGIGVVLNKDNKQLENQLDLTLSKGSSFDYNLQIINDSDKDNELVLMVNLDYTSINFSIGESQNNDKQYIFTVKANDTKTIPVKFSDSKMDICGLHILNFIIMSNPYLHNNENLKKSNLITRHNLIVENDSSLKSNYAKDNADYFKFNGVNGIILNGVVKENKVSCLNTTITAHPGENISIPIIAGGYNTTTEYTLWMTLNWQPYLFDDKKYFLYFNIPKQNVLTKTINITAPKDKGEYELCAYLSTTPWDKVSKDVIGEIDNSSYRITLKVE